MAGLDSIKHLRGDDLIAAYKERYGDKTLLAFSRGKDSIAVALALRDKRALPARLSARAGVVHARTCRNSQI